MPANEIAELTACFVESLSPLKIYLFGSFANGTYTEDSDFDFYIIVDDSEANLHDLMFKAYKSVRHIKKHPVDILVGTQSQFEERKLRPTIENEVYQKGVLIYTA